MTADSANPSRGKKLLRRRRRDKKKVDRTTARKKQSAKAGRLGWRAERSASLGARLLTENQGFFSTGCEVYSVTAWIW